MSFYRSRTSNHCPLLYLFIRVLQNVVLMQVNVLSRDLMVEFERVYEELSSRPDVRAAVLISGKPSGFVAGADITMLAACKTAEEVRMLGVPLLLA